MSSLLILAAVVIIIALVIEVLFGGRPRKAEYEYGKRDCIMTQAEHKCFNALEQAIGDTYYVFPQVHLPSILDHKIKGQKWVRAFFFKWQPGLPTLRVVRLEEVGVCARIK